MNYENRLIDLRSDTVTHSTPAMAHAEVDGVFGDDATVIRFRLVTHYWITAADVEKAVAAFREELRGRFERLRKENGGES